MIDTLAGPETLYVFGVVAARTSKLGGLEWVGSSRVDAEEEQGVGPTGDERSRRVLGTVFGMATRKVTLSLDRTAYAWAESAAARAGRSTSAWLSAAARREAVRLGAGSDWGDHHAQALADDADLAAAEAQLRAAG